MGQNIKFIYKRTNLVTDILFFGTLLYTRNIIRGVLKHIQYFETTCSLRFLCASVSAGVFSAGPTASRAIILCALAEALALLMAHSIFVMNCTYFSLHSFIAKLFVRPLSFFAECAYILRILFLRCSQAYRVVFSSPASLAPPPLLPTPNPPTSFYLFVRPSLLRHRFPPRPRSFHDN